jgi:beta-barrel assembly-enhancing protease
MADQRISRNQIVLTVFFAVALSGCATVNVPNMGEQGYSLEEDEKRLQKRSDEYAEEIDESDLIYQDQALENYLNDIAADLFTGTGISDETLKIHVKVIKDPTFNAFSMANGRIYIHTGILGASDNEHQLAALIGHEMTHILNRHPLKQFRSLENKTAFMSTIAPIGGVPGLFGQLGVITSIAGFSQKLELEADREGFNMMKQSGYDIQEAPKLFERISMFLKDEEIPQPFFFSSHPNVERRIDHYRKLIQETTTQEHLKNGDRYNGIMQKVLLENMKLSLEKGFFKTAERNIDHYIARYKDDAQGYYYRGELLRQRQDKPKGQKVRLKTDDYTQAAAAYTEAIRLDGAFALSYYGAGRVLQKRGEAEEAKMMYQKYLSLEPNAMDRSYIEQYIQSK